MNHRLELGDVIHILHDIFLKYSYYPTLIDLFTLHGLLEGKSHADIAHTHQWSTYKVIQHAERIWNMLSDVSGKEIDEHNFYRFLDEIIEKKLNTYPDIDILRVERSIEFPLGYWEAGTSILSYFSRVLNVKYPNKKIKVRIEQEGLILRMIIDTPDGEKEEIEKTLDEYGLVIIGKMQSQEFISDPIEAMALKNKLEIADLELRRTRDLLNFVKDNSQQRIGSLEVQVEKLHSIIEKGLHSGNNVIGVINKMAEQNKSTYNFENNKFGGGVATEGALQIGGQLIDLSTANSPADAAKEIQELLQQLQKQGVSSEDATQQAASDLAEQAKANPSIMSKVVKWGMDTAGKTTVGEATKGVIRLTLQMLGLPLP